jgi:hypothetical protein
MISVTAKYKQGNTITWWNDGVHTSTGLIADLLAEAKNRITGQSEIIEIVVSPDDEPDLPGLKEKQKPPVAKN